MLDAGLSALIEDLDQRGMLAETLVWPSASSAAAHSAASAPPATTTMTTAATTGHTAIRRHRRRRRQARLGLRQVGQDGLGPLENPVHPRELLATVYHCVGIDPATIVYNHLNQPRELVQAEAVTSILRSLPAASASSACWRSRRSFPLAFGCFCMSPSWLKARSTPLLLRIRLSRRPLPFLGIANVSVRRTVGGVRRDVRLHARRPF